MICAYDEMYLCSAQRIMGDMYDYAINTLGYELNEYQQMFLASCLSHQIEKGNPSYVAGINGCEAARKVIKQCTGECRDADDVMYVDKSPEYWVGWALCYYQWKSGHTFKMIEECAPIQNIYWMYPTYHEMDITHFVEVMDEKHHQHFKESQLKRMRMYAGLTQKALAQRSGVPLRQVQLFEQGERDIGKTQGQTLRQLANALNCDMETLIR